MNVPVTVLEFLSSVPFVIVRSLVTVMAEASVTNVEVPFSTIL